MSSVKISISLVLIVVSASLCSGQGLKRKMADQYFDAMEYYKAVSIYDELATTSVKKNTNDETLFRRTANCYHWTHNFSRSAFWYSKLVDAAKANDEDVLSYIQVLMYNKNYTKAKEVLLSSGDKFSSYPIYRELKVNLDLMTDLMADSSEIKVFDVPVNSGYGEFSPTYYENGLLFVSKKWSHSFVNRKYGWDGDNFVNLYCAKYDKSGKVSKSRQRFDAIFSSKFHNGPICFDKTYKMAIITRDDLSKTSKGALVRLMLYISMKDDKGKWSTPTPFTFNSKDYSVGHPALSSDGKTLYFASDMPGGFGDTDIWKSTWDGSSWSTPQNLGDKINTPGREMFPFIHSHGNMYFASDGHAGMGGLDLFVAFDLEKSPSVENLGYPANTNMDDFALILDENAENGYFSSNRIRSSKKKDQEATDYIYGIKLSIPEFNLNGVVVNVDTKEKMSNTDVKITNNKTNEVVTLQTDENGSFSYKLKSHTSYTIVAGKEKYDVVNDEDVSTEGIRLSKTFEVELGLTSQYLNFVGTVIDSKTRLPIINATFKLKSATTLEEKEFTTDSKGQIATEVKKGDDFDIHASAHDYLAQNSNFTSKNVTNTTIEKTIELTLFAKKGDVVKLEHIYYDLGKWDLRDEGKLELDKLADYLSENPGVTIELSSHTDSRNSASANQKLSQKRAESCVNYLVSKGISKTRMVAKGYGETKLVNKCKDKVTCTEEEHQQNRRTEVKILSN